MPSSRPGVPGLVLTDHLVSAPLDHADPDGPTIEIFAREVVAVDNVEHRDDLPWLLFLQGGPGGKSPRPGLGDGWVAQAARTHRVLLLDQRGTGRSTPLTARTAAGRSDASLAEHVRCLRADAIVDDAELLRRRLAGGRRWTTLAQSYGGFVTLTYLSRAPEALAGCLVLGGLSGIDASADDVYARTYPRVATKNAAYYARYPDDVARVAELREHLLTHDERLPDGDRLTVGRLRLLGTVFGMGDGFERVHWILEEAWQPAGGQRVLSDTFRHEVMALTGFVDAPLFPLQEYIYGQPGSGSSSWAAQRALDARPEFSDQADPLLFTGEMFYPWMFAEIAALRPFAGAADLLAAHDEWPALYDADRLASNQVPVVAAVYHDDMYVDAGLQLDTASRVGNVRTWVTNEWEHDGIRASEGKVLGRLMDMLAGRV